MMNKKRVLHIVLLPSDEITHETISFSKKLSSEFDTFFTLNEENKIPHITLAQIEISEDDVEEEISNIRMVLRNQNRFLSSFVDVGSNNGWIWLCTKTHEILQIHNLVADAQTRGTLLTARPYLPHLTITRIKDITTQNQFDARMLLKKLWNAKNTSSNFAIPNAAIGFAGEHGVFEEVLERIPLNS